MANLWQPLSRHHLHAAARLQSKFGQCPHQSIGPIRGAVAGEPVRCHVCELVLEFRKAADMADPALLVEGGDWLCANDLAAAGMHRAEGHFRINSAKDGFHHGATVIDFANNPVCTVAMVGGNGTACPSFGRGMTTCILENIIAVYQRFRKWLSALGVMTGRRIAPLPGGLGIGFLLTDGSMVAMIMLLQ